MLYIFVITLLAIAAPLAAQNICDICSCTTGPAGRVLAVTCDCASSSQDVNTTRENMKELEHIRTFSASNCNSLTFHQNSFADAHDLNNVTVSHVQRVVYPSGVFTTLSVLKIEDVEDLRLEERAFMGVAGVLSEIIIRRSKMDQLPTHALFGVHGVRKFEMTDVIIQNITANAINIVMDSESQFVVENCKVANIASQAIVLTTNTLQIINSDFVEVSPRAVNVTALTKVEISSTRFGAGCDQEGLRVHSNNILVINNTFSNLPIGLLNPFNESSSKITFSSNFIKNFTLEGVNWNAIDFSNNTVICDCELSNAAKAFRTLNDYSVDHLYKHNYCEAKCGKSISLNKLIEDLVDKSGLCDKDDVNRTDINFLCDVKPLTQIEADTDATQTTDDVISSSLPSISGRAGRAEDGAEDDDSDVTTIDSTTDAMLHIVSKHVSNSSTNYRVLEMMMGTLLFMLLCIY